MCRRRFSTAEDPGLKLNLIGIGCDTVWTADPPFLCTPDQLVVVEDDDET